MKKALVLLTCFVCLTSCSQQNSNKESTVPLSEINISNENAIAALNEINNITCCESFELTIPEQLETVSSFSYGWGNKKPNKEFYDEFVNTFAYLFPEKQINGELLRYYGENSYIEFDDNGNLSKNMNLVKDYYDDIIDGIEDVHHFYYDEAAEYGADYRQNYICAIFANPICGNLSNFNKGKIAQITQIDMYLEVFNPDMYFEYIETYNPNSGQVYHLNDKDVAIYDAVHFYENYINNMPIPKEKTNGMKMCVVSVDVYKVKDGTYGYYFQTAREYGGLPFDYRKSGTVYSGNYGYDVDICNGFMVESNDIDQTYGIYLSGTVINEKKYDRIIPFEKAAELIGDNLTNNVVFQLEKSEIVYCMKTTDLGVSEIEKIKQDTEAAWKFTLFNPNDQKKYICYVDAIDGSDFRYYTISMEQ